MMCWCMLYPLMQAAFMLREYSYCMLGTFSTKLYFRLEKLHNIYMHI